MKDERLGLKVRWAFLGTYAWTMCRDGAEIESHVLILLQPKVISTKARLRAGSIRYASCLFRRRVSVFSARSYAFAYQLQHSSNAPSASTPKAMQKGEHGKA